MQMPQFTYNFLFLPKGLVIPPLCEFNSKETASEEVKHRRRTETGEGPCE